MSASFFNNRVTRFKLIRQVKRNISQNHGVRLPRLALRLERIFRGEA